MLIFRNCWEVCIWLRLWLLML